MAKSRKIIVYCVLLCAALLSVAGFYYYKQYQKKQHRIYLWEQFDRRMNSYTRLLPSKMPQLCENLPVEGTVKAAVVKTNFEEKEYHYEYTIDCDFTLETAERFDYYSITNQQKFLKEWWSCVFHAELDFEKTYMAKYDACMDELCSIFDNDDKPLLMKGNDRYYICTPDHTYRYTGLHNYINIDGREIFIRENSKSGSSSGSSPSSSGGSSGSTGKRGRKIYNENDDYYGAGDYIDADDFASDWEDAGDFEDYEDAYDYYEEVMGHD